jgi:hypothetical protein
MERVIKNAVMSGCLCVLLLALYAAVDGFLHGGGANRQHPPGLAGAFTNALFITVFYGLTVWGIGAIAGAVGAASGIAVDRLRGVRRP